MTSRPYADSWPTTSSWSSRLQTETVNAVAAGDEVLVEQISTMPGSDGVVRRSAVCFLFTLTAGRISRIRLVRNDAVSGSTDPGRHPFLAQMTGVIRP